MLAGLSADYYTRLEQGRDYRPSEKVLEALARALRLDDDATHHLFALSRLSSPAARQSDHAAEHVRPEVQALLDGWSTPAFIHGRHLGVQFHPESTIEIVRSWARSDRDRVRALGIGDGEALLERGRRHATAAVGAAFDLFDAFWRRTRA